MFIPAYKPFPLGTNGERFPDSPWGRGKRGGDARSGVKENRYTSKKRPKCTYCTDTAVMS
jgi:hypothetical protein